MTQEKKQRSSTAAKKSMAKKTSANPEAEAAFATVTPPTLAAAPTGIKAKKTQTKTKAKSLQVSIEDIIRLRAYEIYLQRGATPGNQHEDWQVAEREVRAHFGQEADA
jgi:hypothetical protein